MSLVSLLVGMFLIYNTIEASVVRRRHEIGILRSLGATRGEVRWLFLGEAVVLGAIGIALGMAGGYLLARGLVGTVAETISSLYVLLSVRASVVAPWIWASALFLGSVSVLAAAWFPARGRGSTGSSRHVAPRHPDRTGHAAFARMDCLLVVSSLLLIRRSSRSWRFEPVRHGSVSARPFLFSPASPPSLPCSPPAFSRTATATIHQHIKVRLAAQNLGRTVLRNSVTIASLAAAVAMTVGVAVMVFSFRQTVEDWINQTLVADLFIGPAANEIVGPTSFVPAVRDRLFGKESGSRGSRYLPGCRSAVSQSDHRARRRAREQPANPALP